MPRIKDGWWLLDNYLGDCNFEDQLLGWLQTRLCLNIQPFQAQQAMTVNSKSASDAEYTFTVGEGGALHICGRHLQTMTLGGKCQGSWASMGLDFKTKQVLSSLSDTSYFQWDDKVWVLASEDNKPLQALNGVGQSGQFKVFSCLRTSQCKLE